MRRTIVLVACRVSSVGDCGQSVKTLCAVGGTGELMSE
jgi:hypothetical protein